MKCPICSGKGYYIHTINGDRATYTRRYTCEFCSGTGEVSTYDAKHKCRSCQGRGHDHAYSGIRCDFCNGTGWKD